MNIHPSCIPCVLGASDDGPKPESENKEFVSLRLFIVSFVDTMVRMLTKPGGVPLTEFKVGDVHLVTVVTSCDV